MQKTRTYRIVLRKEPEGAYTALVPSLPGCITWGENVEHALKWQGKPLKVISLFCKKKANQYQMITRLSNTHFNYQPDRKFLSYKES
jgi:hypothetical protein